MAIKTKPDEYLIPCPSCKENHITTWEDFHKDPDPARAPLLATQRVDLTPVENRLQAITQTLEEVNAKPSPQPVDLKPVLDQLTAYSNAVKQDVEHPTPESAFAHWDSCPNCKPKIESYLTELIGGIQAHPSAPEVPKPSEQPKAEIPPAKPKPEPLRRKAFEHWADVPGSGSTRDYYGVEQVKEDGEYFLKFRSEEDFKRALEDESRVIPSGCTVKCDDTGCFWVCED